MHNKKGLTIPSVSEDVEGGFSCTAAVEDVKQYSRFGKAWRFLVKYTLTI